MHFLPLEQGYPLRATCSGSGLELELGLVPASEFCDPFCDETIARCGPPATARWFIPREELPGTAALFVCGAPKGLIFHVARCGSTLVANALKQLDTVTVYSEPRAINDILIPPSCWDCSETVSALRIVAGLLRQHAQDDIIIKLRSWNILFASLIARAFPSTPWVFLVRDPLEVAVSVLRKPPTWLRARVGPSNPFAPFVHPRAVSTEEYVAGMFAAFCHSISRVNSDEGIVLRYDDLPEAISQRVISHFGLWTRAEELQRVARSTRYYSKQTQGIACVFRGDSTEKKVAATPSLRAAVRSFALPAFVELNRAIISNHHCTI